MFGLDGRFTISWWIHDFKIHDFTIHVFKIHDFNITYKSQLTNPSFSDKSRPFWLFFLISCHLSFENTDFCVFKTMFFPS